MKNITSLSVAIASAATLLSVLDAKAQISITGGGLSYSQNFNTLTTNTTAQTWTDNNATTALDSPQVVGLPGWYVGTFSTSAATGTNGFQGIRAGNGSANNGSYYSFGTSGDLDRALGSLPSDGITSGGAGALRLGARFVNNTGQSIVGFTFSFDGEQWRNAGVTNINNQFAVSYGVFGPGLATLANSTYTALTAANFNTPIDGTGTATAAALDGNLAANRIAGLGDTVTGLSVAPGDEIWIRWSDANSSSADLGIGIDNFSITFEVPEPSSLALLALGVAAIVNRRRK